MEKEQRLELLKVVDSILDKAKWDNVDGNFMLEFYKTVFELNKLAALYKKEIDYAKEEGLPENKARKKAKKVTKKKATKKKVVKKVEKEENGNP